MRRRPAAVGGAGAARTTGSDLNNATMGDPRAFEASTRSAARIGVTYLVYPTPPPVGCIRIWQNP